MAIAGDALISTTLLHDTGQCGACAPARNCRGWV